MPSVRSNVILNGINTITGILFPVITFPYAARVLLPEGIGSVNFLNSIIGYIVLLTSLGIPMYAVREVAKYRDDKAFRDKITLEILLLSIVLCLLGYVAVWILAEFIPQIHRHAALFYILSLTIVFTTIGVNWFYQGIEDFKFITVRAIIVRTLAAMFLFIFVHDKSDILIYGMIVVGSTVGNNLINFVHLRKHVNIKCIKAKELNIVRHIKPALEIFVLNLIISLYVQLNPIMIGFISTDEQVGYYAAGTKITHIGLTILTSLGTVLLPRCTNLIQNGDKEGFTLLIKKSLNVTLALSLPMIVGLMVLAVQTTLIFCGNEYMQSIPILYLNAPVILLISLTNIMGVQVLYPMDKVKIVINSVVYGATINLIINFILIPTHGAAGAAISTLISEFIVLILQLFLGKRYYPCKISDFNISKYIISAMIMGLFVYACTLLPISIIWQFMMGVIIGLGVYLGLLIIYKDSLTMELIAIAKNKFAHKL